MSELFRSVSPTSPSSAPLSSPGSADVSRPRRMRLWPGVLIIVLEWLLITVPGLVVPATMTHFMSIFWGPVLAMVALTAWWFFASRLPWTDRWLVPLACLAAAAAAWPFFHPSFSLFGVAIYGLPVATTAWVLWLLLT